MTRSVVGHPLSWYRWDGTDLILQLHVQPRARREGFAGISERGLKVRLTAPAVEGQANEALHGLLAHEFGVPQGAIVLERGATGRHKQIRVRSPRRFPPDLPLTKP